MKKILTGLVGAGSLVLASVASQAAPITDVQEYSNNTSSEYFVINDASKYSSPYYRGASQDWGWTHNAIAGSSFSSIVLDISAFDVDTPYEKDMISVYTGSSWLDLGVLAGNDDAWDFTSFDLTAYSWAESQVNAGLQVKMDIDQLNTGWVVTLGKATLSVDGGNQNCVPTPGVPCTSVVSEPATLGLLGLGLAGLGVVRRKKFSLK